MANEVSQRELQAQRQSLGMEVHTTVRRRTLRSVPGWHHSTLVLECMGPQCPRQILINILLAMIMDGLTSESIAILVLRVELLF